MLLIKSFIIGLAKIIPGVSGAMIAIYFNLYEKIINSITSFFDDWKNNLKFILIFSLGVLLAVIIGSKIILYVLSNYQFITMFFLIGIFLGGTYNFSKKIKYRYYHTIIITIIIIITIFISLININNNYILKNTFYDNLVFFLGGLIDMFASIVPGISGSSLLMTLGIYNNILELISHSLDLRYIISNLNLYLSYFLGMSLSFIFNITLIKYCLTHYKNLSYIIILSLSISSILYLLINTLKLYFTVVELLLGLILFILGMLLSTILTK